MQAVCPPDMMNHLGQMQGLINSLPKPQPTQPIAPASIEYKCENCQISFPDAHHLQLHSEMHNKANNMVSSTIIATNNTCDCLRNGQSLIPCSKIMVIMEGKENYLNE